jgi:transposase-like protein
MSKKVRRTFSDEKKKEILDAYTSGSRTASELAQEHQISTGLIYQWKTEQGYKDRRNRIEELTKEGLTRAMAIKIQQQEAEIEAYQRKVAEQAVIIDLLKKLQTSSSYQSVSELTGLIGTTRKSARKKEPSRS